MLIKKMLIKKDAYKKMCHSQCFAHCVILSKGDGYLLYLYQLFHEVFQLTLFFE